MIDRGIAQWLTDAELVEFDALLGPSTAPRDVAVVKWTPIPNSPQLLAAQSEADIIGYGGAAGGGKSDLICGLSLTQHKRVLIVRREKAQCDGIIQRLGEILGSNDGFNSQRSVWRVNDALLEFGGLDNPGDERRWQGRPHDLIALDEATEMRESQARFLLGWNRTNDPTQRLRILLTFNPPTTVEGRWVIQYFAPWLDKLHPHPAVPGELRWFTTLKGRDIELPDARPFVWRDDVPCYDVPVDTPPEQIVRPLSRTFYPARVTDNPYYMRTGYISTLQALPEPLRSQMLYGDFHAGVEDDQWQVIPTRWIEAAQKRWTRPPQLPPMDSMGVDVARGGKDRTTIARRHGMWFDEPLIYPGVDTPTGAAVAGLVFAARRDEAPVHIDVIGVGASPYDYMQDAGVQCLGVNVAETARGVDVSGKLEFANQRSELWWRMREALDPDRNTGICLPPSRELLAELAAPRWKLRGARIAVESRDDIVADLRKSPDIASAYVLALMDTPKARAMRALAAGNRTKRDYNPLDYVDRLRKLRG